MIGIDPGGQQQREGHPDQEQHERQPQRPLWPGPVGQSHPDFDPTPIVEFNELVAAQDNLVCERVHQGVSSLAFDTGVLTPKDQLVIDFTQHYLAARGPV